MGLFNRMMQNVADRAAYALGDQAAAGRLNLSAATAEVRMRWGQYAGRKAIRAPTLEHVSDFLSFQYGVNWDEDYLGGVVGARPGKVLDMEVALMRIANALIDRGVIIVERG